MSQFVNPDHSAAAGKLEVTTPARSDVKVGLRCSAIALSGACFSGGYTNIQKIDVLSEGHLCRRLPIKELEFVSVVWKNELTELHIRLSMIKWQLQNAMIESM